MLVLGDPVLHVLPAKRDNTESGDRKRRSLGQDGNEKERISLSGDDQQM